MSQKDRVLAKLKEGGWVSTVMAVRGDLGEPILRLGAVIWDLQNPTEAQMKRGVRKWDIEERKVQNKNYSEYRISRPKIEMPPPYRERKPETAKLI